MAWQENYKEKVYIGTKTTSIKLKAKAFSMKGEIYVVNTFYCSPSMVIQNMEIQDGNQKFKKNGQ